MSWSRAACDAGGHVAQPRRGSKPRSWRNHSDTAPMVDGPGNAQDTARGDAGCGSSESRRSGHGDDSSESGRASRERRGVGRSRRPHRSSRSLRRVKPLAPITRVEAIRKARSSVRRRSERASVGNILRRDPRANAGAQSEACRAPSVADAGGTWHEDDFAQLAAEPADTLETSRGPSWERPPFAPHSTLGALPSTMANQ